jgi:tRNA (guanine-N7-)-methyltransferase
MFIGAKKATERKLANTAFLRTQIEMVNDYFATEEVDAIWITFPDPQLRTSRAKKRLTHPRFLRLYAAFLRPGGSIYLKTDSPQLFAFTKLVIELYGLSLVEENKDVYAAPHAPELDIKTHYEALDIAGSNKIFFLHFKLTGDIPQLDDQLQKKLQEIENNET